MRVRAISVAAGIFRPADAGRTEYVLVKRAIRDLSPAYFAMVMATGIVSIAAHLYDMPVIADVLFAGNIVAFLVLLVLTGLRLLWFPRPFFADIADHQRGPGNLTLVAGTCVLGSQFVLITED